LEARVIALAGSQPTASRQRWTLRLLEKDVPSTEGIPPIDHCTIGRVPKKGGTYASPESVPDDPAARQGAFVAAMEVVTTVDALPYDPAYPLVVMDENPLQLLADASDGAPAKLGKFAREDSGCVPHGTCSISV
jgi:hypothetical protein